MPRHPYPPLDKLSPRLQEELRKRVAPDRGNVWKMLMWAPEMAVPFYDNLEATPIDGLSCLVEVERVYGLDWGRFGEDQWRELARIYEGLPGSLRLRDGPMWFGDDEDVPPFLGASVEPPGLQVYGVLPEADWRAWDERFRADAAGLPYREPR